MSGQAAQFAAQPGDQLAFLHGKVLQSRLSWPSAVAQTFALEAVDQPYTAAAERALALLVVEEPTGIRALRLINGEHKGGSARPRRRRGPRSR
jgi:hypothetical protein